MKYDYVIVGSGLFGAVFAQQMTERGKRCLVLEKRSHTGGNLHCENHEGIWVHQYGPHIFHTHDEGIWNYANRFVSFNDYVHSPLARVGDRHYNLPFNLNTFEQVWGVKTATEAQAIIEQQRQAIKGKPQNLKEQAIANIGEELYRLFVEGYTQKQWGKNPEELPASIIQRIPVYYERNNRYFKDRYQGIPIGGYNALTDALLKDVEVRTGIDYLDDPAHWNSQAPKVVYTGPLDAYYKYQFGALEYRSLRFEHERLEQSVFQPSAQVNYTQASVPYTRIVEHKHFEFGTQAHTIITREYSQAWSPGQEPYYPIGDAPNLKRYKQYKALAEQENQLIIGGRLADYRYYDMHQVIAAALHKAQQVP